MPFGNAAKGGIVEAVAGLDEASVRSRCSLPTEIAQHESLVAWLRDVEGAAELVQDMKQGDPEITPGVLSIWVEEFATAADRWARTLKRLEAGGDRAALFDALQPLGDYLLWRARDGIGSQPGRPAVPNMDTDARDTAALFTRMQGDLASLAALCRRMEGKLTALPTSSPAHRERELVAGCVVAFRRHFGKLPPQRGWFGDQFMPHVGECIGLSIGWRVVAETVREQTAHPGPS